MFGESGQTVVDEQRFQQQDVDFRLAVARARARAFGGDVICTDERGANTVRVMIPVSRSEA